MPAASITRRCYCMARRRIKLRWLRLWVLGLPPWLGICRTLSMNKSPTEIDKRVSQRIRVLRKAMQLSHTELGRAVGVTVSSFERQEEAFQSVKGEWLRHSSF